MPILKSAKKRMRQNIKRRARNFPVRSELKTLFKKVLEYIKNGKLEESKKLMPAVYSIIDVAVKKQIMHKNTADRKKSRIAKALNELEGKGAKAPAEKVEEKEKK